MAYQALYRQWRPATFAQMVGQENVVRTLRNQVETGRIAHAYLFCGSRGTGKTSTAKILSRAINCENRDHGDPCGTCESCQRLLRGDSLDVQEIDAASNNGVDQVRDLRDTVQYPPQYGKYKVYIIDEVHMLTTAAFNALLKTLEEPPEYVVFILATTEPQKVPATILSRCQRFDFGRIPANQIAGRLREAADGAQAQVTDSALMLIARAAEGGMRDALSILDMCLGYSHDVDETLVHNVLGTADRSFLFDFAKALGDSDVSRTLHLIDDLMRGGREPIVFARDMSQHLRTLLMAATCGKELAGLLDLTEEDAQEYSDQASLFTQDRLMRILDLFMNVETFMRYSATPRLALETVSVKACLQTEDADTPALLERISELEKKLSGLEKQIQEGAVAAPRKGGQAAAASGQEPPQRAVPEVERVINGSDMDVWKSAMEYLKRAAPGKFALLSQGRFIGAENGCYRWEAGSNAPGLLAMWSKEENRKVIADSLTQAVGSPCTFEAVAPGAPIPAGGRTPESEQQFIHELRDTFGAQNVTVV